MDYTLLVGILALIVTSVGTYYQRESVVMTQKTNTTRRNTPPLGKWWRSPSVIAMAVLCILAWVPTIMSQFPPIPNGGEDQLAQSGYGGTPLPGQFYVAANGRHIMQYASSSKYKLVASLYFDDGAQAEIDAPNLQKSAPYDLSDRELIEIAIKPSPGYIQSFNGRMVKGGTKFALLLVPNNVSPSNFSTIREAQKLGASYLWGGAVAGPQTVPR